MAHDVPVTVEATARQTAERTFDAIVPIDLASVFDGHGPLPAVTGTRDQTGGWDHVGASRTVELADGSTARETVAEYDHPRYFAYTLTFDSMLGRLVDGARGEWWFTESSAGATHVRWRYTFEARTLARPLVSLVIARLWRGYATKVLARAVEVAERP